ncbi:MAG TPA: M28 family peptidase [Bryobacteraceae bacterium]|nr:M28 family peptidase [Bryobacteraceae bacterium]
MPTLGIAVTLAAAESSDASKRWWTHVQVLAADNMEGRDTGSEGYRRAARYVVEQFERAGLKPAGANGYYQSVPLRALHADKSVVELLTGDVRKPLRMNQQITLTPRFGLAPEIKAGLVFAGYAASEADLDGLDLKSKIVIIFSGTPPGSANTPRADSAAQRVRMLAKAGAAGVLSIDNPRAIEPPKWPVAYAKTVAIEGAARAPSAEPFLTMRLNPVDADQLLKRAGHSLAEILELWAAAKPLPHFALPDTLFVTPHVEEEKLTSDNIVAVLPGSDPALSNEYVVVSAHLDGYGIGEPVNGDRIYNGAMDDAACVANLIELAADLHRLGKRFKRSLLFAVFTGEEKGLLGSNYFIAHPTVPKERLAADINLDYLRPIFPLKILTTLGLDESTLGDSVRKVAAGMGIKIQNDDEPERGLFRRSDQFNFIRNGVPGVAFIFGYEKGSREEATYRKWYADRYHRPSDDVNQPVDFAAAAKFQDFFSKLVEAVAEAPDRPKFLLH